MGKKRMGEDWFVELGVANRHEVWHKLRCAKLAPVGEWLGCFSITTKHWVGYELALQNVLGQ